MPRITGTLARLERRLANINEERHRILAEMKTALEQLTLGSQAPMAGLVVRPGAGKRARRRPMDAAWRKKISAGIRKRLRQQKAAAKGKAGAVTK